MRTFELSLLPEPYAICRLEATAESPEWAEGGELVSVTRTREELSVVCEERLVPVGALAERGWRCLRVAGPLDFGLVGVLAALSGVLAEAGVSLFAISTYDTDWVLVRDLEAAVRALRAAGHRVA